MGQSATLYRISRTDFEANKGYQQQLLSLAKGTATFEQTFMGLDFVLKKEESVETQEILDEIFNPETREEYGSEFDYDTLTEEELDDLLSEENSLCFLSPEKVGAIHLILEKLTIQEIDSRFNPVELNEKEVYPGEWNSTNSPDQAFNLHHLLEDFEQLKSLFSKASSEEEYILQYIG